MSLSFCVRLLSDEHPPAEKQLCCCADAEACWEALDEATERLQDAGLPFAERRRRLLRGERAHYVEPEPDEGEDTTQPVGGRKSA